MEGIFDFLIERLYPEDIAILNVMYCKEAFNHFVAVDRNDLLNEINLTDSTLRRSLVRLEASGFINLSSWNRKNMYHLTSYGIAAIKKITEGVEA